MAIPKADSVAPADTNDTQQTLVTGSAAGFDFESFAAGAEKQAAFAAECRQLANEQAAGGRFFNVPPVLVERNYHFICIGLKGESRTEEKRAYFGARGYVNAPKMVRAFGVEDYGDRMQIVCGTPECWARLHNEKVEKAKARHARLSSSNMAAIEAKLRDGMRAGTDLHFTTVMGTGTRAQAEGQIQAAVRDLPKGKR